MDNEFSEDILEFTDEDGNPVKLKVLNQTTINGYDYLLVTDNLDFTFEEEPENEEDMRFIYKDGEVTKVSEQEEKEVECFILKITDSDDEEATCEMVEDEDEVEAITRVFAELMDDAEVN
ncbi:MAG: DUF1292 domain-containing protein, partial [Lachnospiraceae bacterium]|nr:DUF1292 domain-containing protein [Lachnospiraceae bacterium]